MKFLWKFWDIYGNRSEISLFKYKGFYVISNILETEDELWEEN